MEKMHRDLKAFYWRIVSQPEIGIVLVSPEVNQLLIHELEERRRLGNIIPVFVEIPGKYSPYSIDNDPIMLLAAVYHTRLHNSLSIVILSNSSSL